MLACQQLLPVVTKLQRVAEQRISTVCSMLSS